MGLARASVDVRQPVAWRIRARRAGAPLAIALCLLAAPSARARDAGPRAAAPDQAQPGPESTPTRAEDPGPMPSFVPGLRSRARLSETLRSRLRDSIDRSRVIGTPTTEALATSPDVAEAPQPPASRVPPPVDIPPPPAEEAAPRARGHRLRAWVTADGITVLSNDPGDERPGLASPEPVRLAASELRAEIEAPAPAPTPLPEVEALPLQPAPEPRAARLDDGLWLQLGLLSLLAVGLAVAGLVLWRKNASP